MKRVGGCFPSRKPLGGLLNFAQVKNVKWQSAARKTLGTENSIIDVKCAWVSI